MFFKEKLYNIIFFFYILICVILLILYYIYDYVKSNDNIEDFNNSKNTKYIVWNGDLDSTYHLINTLKNTDSHIQPLFFHNDNQTSSNYKIKIMNKILKKIEKTFEPEVFSKLLSVKYIDTSEMNDIIKRDLFKKTDNYVILNKIATYANKKNIAVDIILNPEQKKEKLFMKYLDRKLENKCLTIDDTVVCFPLHKKLRKNYKKIDDEKILQLTWSCLNPDAKTGKNCYNCIKCNNFL